MATDILKEFLVSIGYKEDLTARKKVIEGITGMTTAVVRLGAVIESTALAVSVGVAKWASSLEQLYFTSRRTGESADQLTAYSRAMQNFGVSADEATASVEGLASFLRNNPGGSNLLAGWLGAVGLSAKDANGRLLDQAGLLRQLGRMFAIEREQGRTFFANQQAGMIGISERSMLAMSTPGFAEEEARQDKRTKGFAAAAAAAHRFMESLRDLKQQFEQLMLPFEMQAIAALEKLMPKLSKLMRDHGKQIVDDLAGLFAYFIDGIGKLFDFLDRHGKEWVVRLEALFLDLNFNFTMYIEPVFGWLYDLFVKLDKVTDGWASKIALVALGLKALGGGGILSGISNLAKGLVSVAGTIGGGLLSLSEGAGALAVGATGLLGAGAVAAGGGLGYWFDKQFPNNPLAKMGQWIGGALADAKDFADRAYKADLAMRAREPSTFNPKTGATVINNTIHNDVTVHGNADPHKVGAAVADATEGRLSRLNANLVREFSAVVR